MAQSIINTPPNEFAISTAVKKALSIEFQNEIRPFKNGELSLYGHGDASRKIKETIKAAVQSKIDLVKNFYDLPSADPKVGQPLRETSRDLEKFQLPPKRTFIIAEAGVNHNGSLETALKLIDAAKEAGADAVKFQTFKAEKLATKAAALADYQQEQTTEFKSQFEMLQSLELTDQEFKTLAAHCRRTQIEFMSTPFDLDSLRFLVYELDMARLKIPSGEITNAPLLLAAAQTDIPLIVSTGMCSLEDVRAALTVLAFGCSNPLATSFFEQIRTPPWQPTTQPQMSHQEATRLLSTTLGQRVTLLHAVSEYPAPFEDVNLRAMATLRQEFGLPVGLSDHTLGYSVPVAAVALGAAVIEKHFTLDQSMPGPDHRASLNPLQLKEMVSSIRQVELAMGTPEKRVTPSEAKNQTLVRKSIVAARPIRKGQLFTSDDLAVMRPGTGLSPFQLWSLLDTPSPQDFAEGDLIRLTD
jgi:N-acetylneuraminate synthase